MSDEEGRIFINYRRDDDPGSTGRLFDRLETHFKPGQLFLDVDSIPPGLDFVKVLDDKVGECDVFLAVIGRDWLDAVDENGARRLDNPDDFVRIEIESALKRGIRVIPVLMSRADMPAEDKLPESLKPFARRNAVRLSHDRFKADCDGLIKAIERSLETAKPPESKASELANWGTIKNSTMPQDFADHLSRFPNGVTRRMAEARLEEVQWKGSSRPEIVAMVVVPFQILAAILFDLAGWNFFSTNNPDDSAASGLLAAFLPILGSVLVLAYRRRSRLGAPEVANYWLACLLGALPVAVILKSPMAVLTGSVIAVGTARALAFTYRRERSGSEIGTYWVGCSLVILVSLIVLFSLFQWDWLGEPAYLPSRGGSTGLLLGFCITIASAAYLGYRRWPLSGIEGSAYWLGCLIAAAPALGTVFKLARWHIPISNGDSENLSLATGILVALIIGLMSAWFLVYPRRLTVSAAELRRYWFGCSLVAVLACGILAVAMRSSFGNGAIIGLALSAAGAGALVLWWQVRRKNAALQAAQA